MPSTKTRIGMSSFLIAGVGGMRSISLVLDTMLGELHGMNQEVGMGFA